MNAVNVGYLLAQRARLGPDRPAITFGTTALTYGELDERVNRLANGLTARGVTKGDRIAVMLTNCHQYYELLFACAKLGALLVTVNYRLVEDEVRHVLTDAEPAIFLYGPEFTEIADALCAEGGPVAPVLLGDQDGRANYAELTEAPADPPSTEVALGDPLIIMYTSGTTGLPKGAVLTHENVLYTSFNQLADWSITAADRCLVVAPLYHVGGLLVLAFPCLHVGGSVHIHSAFEPAAVLDSIESDQITTLFLAPTMWNMLLQQPGVEQRDVGAIRLCCSGGEALPVAVMERLISIFGPGFVDGYGLTEASSCSTVLRSEHVIAKRGSVGMSFLHNVVRVVDEAGDEVAAGESGEIVQRGPTVMRGYWRRPEATEAAIRDGWLHTGDVGRFDSDGFLWILDRTKDMIISGAENIYPAEVEQVLYRHPSVLEVAVIGAPDATWGERVTAVVVARDGCELAADEIEEFCHGKLAGYKRPRSVVFVESLPRNASGKVLKRVLRESINLKGAVT